MENNVFNYRYSATQNKEVERIRERYLPKEESKLDALRRLDRRVQSAGTLTGLIVGIVGCLLFGIGMCYGLDVFAGADIWTLLFCILGAAVMLPAYPIYRRIAHRTKEKLTPEILRLSEEIMKPTRN